MVDAESAERALAGLAHVRRVPPDEPDGRIVGADDPELGGHHHLVAPTADRPSDELLVDIGAVHVGRVEERHAEFERPVDRGDRPGLVAGAVELAHAHAAQSLDGDDGPAGTEPARGESHGRTLPTHVPGPVVRPRPGGAPRARSPRPGAPARSRAHPACGRGAGRPDRSSRPERRGPRTSTRRSNPVWPVARPPSMRRARPAPGGRAKGGRRGRRRPVPSGRPRRGGGRAVPGWPTRPPPRHGRARSGG